MASTTQVTAPAVSTRFSPQQQPSVTNADVQKRDVALAGLEHGYKQWQRLPSTGDDAKMTFNNWVFLKTPSQHNYETHCVY